MQFRVQRAFPTTNNKATYVGIESRTLAGLQACKAIYCKVLYFRGVKFLPHSIISVSKHIWSSINLWLMFCFINWHDLYTLVYQFPSRLHHINWILSMNPSEEDYINKLVNIMYELVSFIAAPWHLYVHSMKMSYSHINVWKQTIAGFAINMLTVYFIIFKMIGILRMVLEINSYILHVFWEE